MKNGHSPIISANLKSQYTRGARARSSPNTSTKHLMFVFLWGRDVTCWHRWQHTQVSLIALCWVCGSCTTASPPQSLMALLLQTQILSFKASCLSGAGALCSVSLVSGQLWQPCGPWPGHVANAAAWVQMFRDLTWPWRLRSCLCPLKGSNCGSTNKLGQSELRQTYVTQIVTLRPDFISTYRTTFSVNRSVVVKDSWIQNDWV